nr:SDR family NAD(P)-dependent oxidoreductase [Sphingopyxis lindanitolerans]
MMLPTTPSFRLDGRRALVTGAGRGIGLALAAALAEGGAEVVLAARSAQEIEGGAKAIRAKGGHARAVQLDVSNLQAVSDFFDAQPAFHILVNNAGTNRPMPMHDVTPEDYDAVLSLNLKAVFFVTQHCSRRMIEAGIAGGIIHIGSQMGHVGASNRTLYCASKWGLEGFNKAMAIELAPHNIRSNIIAPTFIETPLTKPFFENADFRAEVLGKIKLGRLGMVNDLMGAVLYLASDASALATGTSMLIDGGWTAD